MQLFTESSVFPIAVFMVATSIFFLAYALRVMRKVWGKTRLKHAYAIGAAGVLVLFGSIVTTAMGLNLRAYKVYPLRFVKQIGEVSEVCLYVSLFLILLAVFVAGATPPAQGVSKIPK